MTKFDSQKHHRNSIRLKNYDYSSNGAYFITVCTYQRLCVFGDIIDGEIVLNEIGKIVQKIWDELPNHNWNIVLDKFVVMPNHVHGIIVIENVGAGSKPTQIKRAGLEPAPTEKKDHGLQEIVRQLKTFSARHINELRERSGTPVWQRNYYEHIIRNDSELNKIRDYIQKNAANWHLDEENPINWGNIG
jgi:putative transposase